MSEAENTSKKDSPKKDSPKKDSFFKHVKAEFKRCTWPKKEELIRQSTLVIIILPNITSRIGIKIPPMLDHKHWVFPLLGIIMSFVFLYNSFNLVKRFQICSQTYDKLIKQLPQNLRRETIFPKKSKILKQIHPYVVPSIMFFCLFFLSILFFTIYLPFA